MLSTMSGADRDLARAKVLGLSASGINERRGRRVHERRRVPDPGTAIGERDIVLLSDGMENEGRLSRTSGRA